jgi:hypothetical protein
LQIKRWGCTFDLQLKKKRRRMLLILVITLLNYLIEYSDGTLYSISSSVNDDVILPNIS